MLIPWALCVLIDDVAWLFGYQTYVRAMSGAWGVERIFFVRRDPQARRLKRLRPAKRA